MIALALLAVDDDGAQKAETSPRVEAPLVGAAAALQNSAETAPKLEVSAPAALPLNDANRAAESARIGASSGEPSGSRVRGGEGRESCGLGSSGCLARLSAISVRPGGARA